MKTLLGVLISIEWMMGDKRMTSKKLENARIDTFAMRINSEERRMIQALAERLQRSQSDTVRLLIREAVRSLLPSGNASGATQEENRKEIYDTG